MVAPKIVKQAFEEIVKFEVVWVLQFLQSYGQMWWCSGFCGFVQTLQHGHTVHSSLLATEVACMNRGGKETRQSNLWFW